jgi:hypothetical protein
MLRYGSYFMLHFSSFSFLIHRLLTLRSHAKRHYFSIRGAKTPQALPNCSIRNKMNRCSFLMPLIVETRKKIKKRRNKNMTENY